MTCPICKDCGWICETHALEAWPCELCNAAGVPCACNPEVRAPPGFKSIASVDDPKAH